MVERDSDDGVGAAAPLPLGTLSIAWAQTAADRAEAGRFLARAIGGDTRYISHGEIQGGLSPDGLQWAPNLEALIVEDLAAGGAERSVLIARGQADEVVAAAILFWETAARTRFAVLEDMSVAPTARSSGIGAAMIAELEAEARRRDMRWLFLESGRDNLRAHGFFQRHGFSEISHVFAKPLDDAAARSL